MGATPASFDAVAAALFGWDLHRRAGLRVRGHERVSIGARMDLQWRAGPVRVTSPVEVIDVSAGETRRGFRYRALPGHPEEGEESFAVERRAGRVWFLVSARSRPATWWARLGAPVTRLVQRRLTRSYLRAAAKIASSVDSQP